MIKIELKARGPFPPYYYIADHLWGDGADIDSDGDSTHPDSTDWTELTLILRKDEGQRIDIDPIEGNSGGFLLRSESEPLANKVVAYLKQVGAVV